MKLDNKTIFSILLVLLFVGSIFAIMTTGGDRAKPGSDINSDLNVNLTPVNYNAQFDANVLEVFPQIIVAGKPVDYDQASIDNKLLELQGLKSKNVSFRQTEDGSINVVITLNILADKKQEIVSKIKELNIIEEPIEMYQYALLSVPAEVNFTNDNNQEILYSFGATPIEGIINIETLKEDNISVACYATFSGQKLLSATGIEMYNISSYPQMLISSGDFNVISYDDIIYSEINFDFNENNMGGSVDQYLEYKINKEYPNSKVTLEVTKPLIFNNGNNNKEEITETLNNIKTTTAKQMKDLNATGDFNNSFDFEVDENTTTVTFGNYFKHNFLNYILNKILFDLKYLPESGYTDNPLIVQRPVITANIEFETNYVDKEKLAEILNKKPEDLNLKTLVTVDTSNLIIENKKYNYEETSTQALVDYPQDLNKTTLTLQIQAYVQRDNILYLGLQK